MNQRAPGTAAGRRKQSGKPNSAQAEAGLGHSRDAKYVYNPSDRDEFYDLADDPHETRNIIDRVSAERLKPYKDRLLQGMADSKDPLVGYARKTIWF